MNIGHLRDHAQIVKHEQISEDEGFGAKYDWITKGKIWCEMLKQRITPQTVQGDAEAVLVTQGFRIRPTAAISKGDRLAVKGHTYDVIDVDTSQKDYYTLTCREVRL